MSELPDYSVHLMVTSPPYNVRKEYDEDLTLEEYLDLLQVVFYHTYRVLVTVVLACINFDNLCRMPYLPPSPSTAWGSWQSASNPVLRDVHEYILVFSKESFSRKPEVKEDTIGRESFLEWTKSIWTFPAVSAKRIGHPAPFPEELPRRLIDLYTFKNDVVLDPFCGSGTTCLAAFRLGRQYIGYEINPQYKQLAEERLGGATEGDLLGKAATNET
jgi:site-specific DNA-methyltransferase (adenine-specific)